VAPCKNWAPVVYLGAYDTWPDFLWSEVHFTILLRLLVWITGVGYIFIAFIVRCYADL